MTSTIASKHASGVDLNRLAELSDEELLRRYCRYNQREAFAALVWRYEAELYSYLRRYLGDAAAAEDAFQTTFLQVHLNRDKFEHGRRFRPWLYAIAVNQAIDSQRRNKRHKVTSLDRPQRRSDEELGSLAEAEASREPDPTEQLELVERRHLVQQAVANLPDVLRHTVLLIYYQGMKYREAAEVLKVPVGTIKSRLHAAVLKLNQLCGASEVDEHD